MKNRYFCTAGRPTDEQCYPLQDLTLKDHRKFNSTPLIALTSVAGASAEVYKLVRQK